MDVIGVTMKLYSRTVTLRLASGLVRSIVISDTLPHASATLTARNAVNSARHEVCQWDRNPVLVSVSPVSYVEVSPSEPSHV